MNRRLENFDPENDDSAPPRMQLIRSCNVGMTANSWYIDRKSVLGKDCVVSTTAEYIIATVLGSRLKLHFKYCHSRHFPLSC